MPLPQAIQLQRVLVVAVRTVPLTLCVLLLAPMWLTWPYLSEARRVDVLKMVKQLVDWARATTDSVPSVPQETDDSAPSLSSGGIGGRAGVHDRHK